MRQFLYPAILTLDEKDGGYVVTFPDIPEAITQGDTVEEALSEASDCLAEAIANRIVLGLPIPEASSRVREAYMIPLPGLMAAKAALYLAIQKTEITKAELAKKLECDEKKIDLLLDPSHVSDLTEIESALAVLKQRLVVGFQEAA